MDERLRSHHRVPQFSVELPHDTFSNSLAYKNGKRRENDLWAMSALKSTQKMLGRTPLYI